MKLLTFLFLVTVCVSAQSNQRQSDDHFHGVQQRGEAHEGMGFSQTETTHHFILIPRGGYIQVTANDRSNRKNIEQVQTHFAYIARRFAQGDFAIPHFVHDQNPPGVKTMTALVDEISYSVVNLDDGARLVITTKSPEAIVAIQDFLRFQIKDHRTGDSLSVSTATN